MISAVLLAAGESRRMGSFKQLLPFGGKTFVECCVDNLLASRAGEVVVVTGHRSEEVRTALAGRPVQFVHNPDYAAGMAGSIKRGVESLAPRVRAALIALSDQPQIASDVFDRVAETYINTAAAIVIPTHEGRGGHPILLDMRLRNEILSMDAEQGLRQVVRAHNNEVVRIELAQSSILQDFDYPEDLKNVR